MSKSPMKMPTKIPSEILGEKSDSSNSNTTWINKFIFFLNKDETFTSLFLSLATVLLRPKLSSLGFFLLSLTLPSKQTHKFMF